MGAGGIIVLCIVVLTLIISVVLIRVFNKLSVKKMVVEGKYTDLDNLFLKRYEKLPEFLNICESAKASEELELAVKAEMAEERVAHDKNMSEAIADARSKNAYKLSEGKGAELCEELDVLGDEISEAYSAYNAAAEDYEKFRCKPMVKGIANFFSFEEKPVF